MLPANHKLRDFRNFLYLLWVHLGLPSPTKVQYDIAHYLQHGPSAQSDTMKRQMIQAFRGVGKSFITAAFVLWLLLLDPQLRIKVVSANEDRAREFAMFVKQLIEEVPILEHLKAKPGHRDSVLSFDVGPAGPDQAPSVSAVGISGQLTGGRADVLIADDIEVPKNSLTLVMRERLAEAVKEFDALIKPLPTSRIIYLGTPQTEESVYRNLPERGYDVRIWPARVPNAKQLLGYGPLLAGMIRRMVEKLKPGKATDPERFDELDLAAREASYGRSGFALQFMLDTSLSDAERYPLRLRDLIVMDLDAEVAPAKVMWSGAPDYVDADLPVVGFQGDRLQRPMFITKDDMASYTGSVMFIDPAGRGNDDTGYAVVKYLNGKLFLTAAGGSPGGYEENALVALAKIARDQKVNLVIIESNFGDGMFAKLFSPILRKFHPCPIEEQRATQQKELRIIETLEPLMNQHRFVVDREVLRRGSTDGEDRGKDYLWAYQLTHITKDRGCLKHDDVLDAIAGACQYWLDSMASDEQEALDAYKEEALARELDSWAVGIGLLGNDQVTPNWLDA